MDAEQPRQHSFWLHSSLATFFVSFDLYHSYGYASSQKQTNYEAQVRLRNTKECSRGC
ncbi:MAG: hypothetical protein QG659_473 [Patescibacteria group bacterium]|nr:hypothetical protein [Patescibacteria group bacterium]